MTKRTTKSAKERICYRPIKTKQLIAMALRDKNTRGAITRLLDECIIAHLGPKYPKLLEDIKAAERVLGNAEVA